jgi:hypothetical protein
MNNLFLFAIYTTALFCLSKMLEMKFIDHEIKPLRELVRDCVIVFSCSLSASYGYLYTGSMFTGFMNYVTENKIVEMTNPEIFTNKPEF